MKKAAILTIIGLGNYGNRLQNYAMQHILEKTGCQVETIKAGNNKRKWFEVKTKLLYPFASLLKENRRVRIQRRTRFIDFEKNITYSKDLFDLNDGDSLAKGLEKYDYVIYGSDQIWNTEFKSFSKAFLGYYAPKKKNIAVSASFGKTTVESRYTDLFKQGFARFKAISVREESGKDLVQNFGYPCIVTPDPTLVVDKDTWISLEKKADVQGEYAFTYFLEDEHEIISEDSKTVVHGEMNSTFGPGEFLYLIHNADIVYTNSFHACVFSIIYETPFCIYPRKGKFSSMSSRIDTLFSLLGIEGEQKNDCRFVSAEELQSHKVRNNLETLRNTMEKYLLSSLDICRE